MNHKNSTKTQKKEGCNRQNVHFCSSHDSRDCPEEHSNGISDTNNPPEIEWTDDESYEYTESYIATTHPAGEVIQLLYRGNYYIGFLFSEQ